MRRLSAGVPGDVAGRNADAPDDDAVPQPGIHGRRGVDPRQSDRRRGPAGRLRQNYAGTVDGRGELQSADPRRVRGTDAQWLFQRPQDRLGHLGVGVQRRGALGLHVGRRFHGCRDRHVTLRGALHDHGHRVDDGVDGGSARHGLAQQRSHSRRRCAALYPGSRSGSPHRRHGGRRSHHGSDPHARSVRKRDHGQRRNRRIHERSRAPAGTGRARGCGSVAG